jgi:hypothetical protein
MNLDELMKQKELLQQKLGLEGGVLFETALATFFRNSCSSCRVLPSTVRYSVAISIIFLTFYLEMF